MSDVVWQRLHIRLVHQGLIRVALSLPAGYLGMVLRDEPVWPLVAGCCFGLLGALSTLVTWRTTRFRITDRQVEMHTGWLSRKHRTVARDRIRTVDVSARLLQRVLRLRTVHIGAGEAGASFDLDGLDRRQAERIRQELMPGRPPETAAGEAAGEPEVVIARLRRQWVPLNVIGLWSAFAVVGPLVGLHWALRAFGIDLLAAGRGLLGGASPGWTVAVVLLIAYPIGVALRAGTFLMENWRFVLVRTGTAPDTVLVTRRGLLTTRTVQRTDARIRGISFEEPLLWRWLRLTRTRVLATGQQGTGETAVADVLPRIRLGEARELAARILPDGSRPLQAALRRHPRGALVRRLGLAVYGPALTSGAVLTFTVSGALPGRWWLLPLLLVPMTLPLAVVAYRALGHAVSGAYLVVRTGAVRRRTVALQRRAVIGWTVEQSILQRIGGRMTVGIATAAGARHYEAPDMGTDQATAFIAEVTPQLAGTLLER